VIKVAAEPDNAIAVVELVVEVAVGAWGADCTVKQAMERAARDAYNKLQSAFSDSGTSRIASVRTVRVICPSKKPGG
jgi:hypothetical protein